MMGIPELSISTSYSQYNAGMTIQSGVFFVTANWYVFSSTKVTQFIDSLIHVSSHDKKKSIPQISTSSCFDHPGLTISMKILLAKNLSSWPMLTLFQTAVFLGYLLGGWIPTRAKKEIISQAFPTEEPGGWRKPCISCNVRVLLEPCSYPFWIHVTNGIFYLLVCHGP